MKGKKMTYKKWDMEYNVIDLQKYGIKNFAFDLPSAVSYMYEAVSNGFLILGGDIIVNDHGIFVESVDGWYSEKNTPLDTMQDALNYFYHLRFFIFTLHQFNFYCISN